MTGPTTPAEADEKPPTTLFSRSNMVHDQEADNAEMRRENEFLMMQIEELKRRIPSDDELAWMRATRREQENAAWAWQQIRKHAPWVLAVATTIGAGLAYLAGHNVHVMPK